MPTLPSNFSDVRLNINLTFGKGKGDLKRPLRDAIGLGIQNVGFRAAKNRQRKLQSNLQRDFAPVVERELQKMARDVARMGVGIANYRNPPDGTLSIDGPISSMMAGDSGPMTVASVTGEWAVRTKTYMKWKFKKYGTRKWFKNTGRLQDQLGKVGTYRSAYGPISIRFRPTNVNASSGAISTLGRSSGGQSTNIILGTLEVKPLRRLRLGDLPGIGEKASYNAGLLSPLADSIERKLTGRKGKYRPVIEPFLTYYMGRKIPNAVYRRLEKTLS